MRIVALFLAAATLAVLVGGSQEPARAGGRDLDGRLAPDLQFAAGGLNGIDTSTRLSTLRGRPIYVKFWLRDCPVCRRELPRVQQLHERFGRLGLAVITVVDKFAPGQVQPVMQKLGFTFPVGCDADGSQGRKYGVGRGPTECLIGIDGRVKASNTVSDEALEAELGKYRLARVDPLPRSLKAVRDAVWKGRLGTALKGAEQAARGQTAQKGLAAAVARVLTLARETLEARAAWADQQAARGQLGPARAEYAGLGRAFAGTSLGARAAELEAAFSGRHPSK